MADDTEDMAALRAEYAAKMGKPPFNGWDAATLREKMANGPDPEPAPSPPPAPLTKTVSLTGDHVHMPVDLLTPAWEACADTTRYNRRVPHDKGTKVAKYTMHRTLADFLIKRDQAIEVVPDESQD